ncbi:hypothetical protein F892_01508 [Acinetobacter vivianii]|jgi:hypothetical protein|uniref:Uncharacterized protein n=1 Tax=Acinetobacter vivianii TaxID=1776742 RepID=N8UYN2_9GAMM|nr:hypothetical protein [Acinetobacter vivianii]ENU92490.1 hypothetical protein F971_02381 [Acinetobacter vivianii]ENX22266.1 hypothetical protein F892_01508 [Acinetobacter vivianii]GGI58635.1 hypothetical protein GCM10011446_01300 [Acinetobacter vivianii]
MSAKDNQLIGSNFHSSSQYIPDRMMDLDEWERDSARHHKSLSERRKCRLAHERKKKCLWMMDE